MPRVDNCTCGSMPQMVDICRGHKESLLLTGGMPDACKLVCPKCGYETAEHMFAADAVDEWNRHAKGGVAWDGKEAQR